MKDQVLKTYQLTKRHGDQLSNNRINMTINKGDIYGLIGQNGAGKTTLIRLITGLIHPTEGQLELFGKSEGVSLEEGRERIGSLIESPTFYENMTARENLELSRLVRGISGELCIDDVLELVGLSNVGKKKVKHFSLGMKQRLGIANALLGNPRILILDEPINGLDPMAIVEMRELLKKVNREKEMTILISSHILGELSEFATCYGIMNKGELIEEISAEELNEKCRQYIELEVDDVSRVIPLLEREFGITQYKVLENQLIKIYSHLDCVGQINAAIAQKGFMIEKIGLKGDSLETYFIEMIGGVQHV